MSDRAQLRATERALALGPGQTFSERELDGLDEPVRRYFAAAIEPGTPLWPSARITIRGSIRLGRWLPFRATETLAPRSGFLWRARVAGLVSGFDRYLDGVGEMAWRFAGLVPVMRASGDDVSRSAAARAGGEGIWLPTALLGRFGVDWHAVDAEIVGRFTIDDTPVELHHRIDEHGAVTAGWFERWGDPDRNGTFGWHTCGGDVTAHARFGGLTIPSAGRFGWFYGSDRSNDGEFFRYEITDIQPHDTRR